MPSRDQRILLVLAGLSVALALVQAVVGLSADALLAVPVLALFLPLLAGRYVGERCLRRLATLVTARRRRTPAPRVPLAARGGRRARPRGGRLIAVALAHRGPPAAVLAR